ncbi:phage baseplate assembly protein V [Pseudomonas mosselii]|uniref:phage baseplate assembly protein V n=1 Tax=Pseudomonas mosselii TaxID=78327 RepID=UPI003F1C5C97
MNKALAGVARGLGNLLARAVLTAKPRQGKLQSLQVALLEGEAKEGVELFEPYGLTGVALPGAEGLIAFLGGHRTHGVALVQTDRRYRPVDLQPGEVALFNHEGTRVVLRNGGKVEVLAAAEVKVATAKVILQADVEVIGNTTFTGTVTANGKRIDESHRHPGDSGGQTGGVL